MASKECFVLTLPLKTEIYQADRMDKRLKAAKDIYNATLGTALKTFENMCKNTDYLELRDGGNRDYGRMREMLNAYGITDYSIQMYASGVVAKHFKGAIDAVTAQKVGARVYRSLKDSVLFRNNRRAHFVRWDQFNSVEGKSNKQGIRFVDEHLIWGKSIKIKADIKTDYEREALNNQIKYCRVLRKFVNNKRKYYIQIIIDGRPPTKDGIKKEGNVGLDIGTSTIAVSSNSEVSLHELADKVLNIESEKTKILRYLDRSRRASNPDNFLEDGSIRPFKKLSWVRSKRYVKEQNRLRYLYSKQAEVRKYQHNVLAKHIVSLGDNIYVEDMNFRGLSARAKKTEKNDRGKYKRKKRFGKSIGNRAPAMLISMIEAKARAKGIGFHKVHTAKLRASQFNHDDGTYKKKKLSQRTAEIGGYLVQRDLYSAYLIQHVKNDLESFDIVGLKRDFHEFIGKHNAAMER